MFSANRGAPHPTSGFSFHRILPKVPAVPELGVIMASRLEIGSIVALVAAVAGGALWMGELRGDVNALEKRVGELEKSKTISPRKLAVGDVCYKLLDSLDKALDAGEANSLRTIEIQSQIDRFKCYDNMPAAMLIPANEVENAN